MSTNSEKGMKMMELWKAKTTFVTKDKTAEEAALEESKLQGNYGMKLS